MRQASPQRTSSGTPNCSASGRRTSISSTSPALRTRTRPRPSAWRRRARRSSIGRSRTLIHRLWRRRSPPNPHKLESSAAKAATIGVGFDRTRSLRTAPFRKPACVQDDAAFRASDCAIFSLNRPGLAASMVAAISGERTLSPGDASSTTEAPPRSKGSRASAVSKATSGRALGLRIHKPWSARQIGSSLPTPYSWPRRYKAASRARIDGLPRRLSLTIAPAGSWTRPLANNEARSANIIVLDWCGPPPADLMPSWLSRTRSAVGNNQPSIGREMGGVAVGGSTPFRAARHAVIMLAMPSFREQSRFGFRKLGVESH